jgi:hypothetical protein
MAIDFKPSGAFDEAWKRTCPICKKRMLFFRECVHSEIVNEDEIDGVIKHLKSEKGVTIKHIIIQY